MSTSPDDPCASLRPPHRRRPAGIGKSLSRRDVAVTLVDDFFQSIKDYAPGVLGATAGVVVENSLLVQASVAVLVHRLAAAAAPQRGVRGSPWP